MPCEPAVGPSSHSGFIPERKAAVRLPLKRLKDPDLLRQGVCGDEFSRPERTASAEALTYSATENGKGEFFSLKRV